MKRRNFIKGTSLIGLSGLSVLSGCSINGYLEEYIEGVMNKRDLREGKFLSSLENYVVESETILSYEGHNESIKGMGIIYKDGLESYYFTLSHIVNHSEGIDINSRFGLFKYLPKDLEFFTEINGVKLEKLVSNLKDDVAIFKIPSELDNLVNVFPLEVRTNLNFGERVAILGNPDLRGYHPRIGRITDMNGIILEINGLEDKSYSNSIGTDIDVMPGDSASPVISMGDNKLVGIMGLKFGGMSYFKPIKSFLDYLPKTKDL